jgi:hypothetical protein
MRIEDAAEAPQFSATADGGGCADEVAESVDGTYGSGLERARKKRARQVRVVMLDVGQPPPHVLAVERQARRDVVGDASYVRDVRQAIANRPRAQAMA